MDEQRQQQAPRAGEGKSPVDALRRAKRIELERKVLKSFIEVYCRKHHESAAGLCEECADLQEYALSRLARCPYDPKPKCKKCPTHCYKPEYRQRIREVMKFSGIYYVRRGRLDWLVRYFMI